MIRKLLALLILVSCAPALAVEHITDTTLSDGTFFTPHTGWSHGTNKWTATNVAAQRLDHADATILKGHTYRYSVTIANWTQGSLQVMLGAPKGVPSGTNVPTVDLNGLAPIADNFTTANGITTAGIPAHDDDLNGAMRFRCGFDKILPDDPLLYPGQPGGSHLHINYGNRGWNANSNFNSLRKSGGTSCGRDSAPIYRTAFWTPAMLDGAGYIILPIYADIYYKTISRSNPACLAPGATYDPTTDSTHIGICVPLPNGLRYVTGYNMKDGTGGPLAGDPMFYKCMDKTGSIARALGGNSDTYLYRSLTEMYTAGCRTPGTIQVTITAASCWNGTQIDTVNHHDHVSFNNGGLVTVTETNGSGATISGPWGRCPVDKPYVIPTAELHLFYTLDAAWDAGKWRLSSDEQMGMPMTPGATLHVDYWEAWSPTVKNTWQVHCIDEHRTCASGELGDGTEMRGDLANAMRNFTYPDLQKIHKVSLTKFGYSRLLQGNGTFTGEITPIASGMISLYSPDGGTFDVTALSITDVTQNTTHTPITVHGSK